MSRRLLSRVAFCVTLGSMVGAGAALVALPALGAETPDLAGIYELKGETTVEGSPDRLSISGKLIIRQNGVNCTTVVEAAMRRTTGESGPVSAALLGSGEFTIAGADLTGTAELQSLVSEVPELDVAVPFAPRRAGPVLDATVAGKLIKDGVIEMRIHSTLTGEGFTLPEGRKTVVTATRVARRPTELKKKK